MDPQPIGWPRRAACVQRAALILLTLPYWRSGIAKLADLPGALAEASNFGLEPAPLAVVATIMIQLIGSALIILRRWSWLGAGTLGVFTLAATLIAHPFWAFPDAIERFHQANIFAEHLGLIGGLALAAMLAETKPRFRVTQKAWPRRVERGR